jgi:hypothetical protein
MAENPTPVAPAQTPAAESPTIPQGENPNNRQAEIARLTEKTEQGIFEQGRAAGREEGRKVELKRLNEIIAACPGRPAMAISAFLEGQSAAAVKLANDAAIVAEQRTREVEAEKDMEIRRLKAVIATGGYPDGVQMGVTDDADNDVPVVDPKAQAEREWDRNPKVRKDFTSKANYVSYRKAQLTGRVAEPSKSN